MAVFRMTALADPDALVDVFYAAYAGRDVDAAAALYAEDGFHEEIAFGKRRNGRAAIGEGLAGLFRMLPDVTFSQQTRIVSGSSVAVVYTMRGTFTPRPPDGKGRAEPKPVILEGLHLFECLAGELQGTKDYWNLDRFKQQIA